MTQSDRTAVIIGVGPGLGMSMAHRLGAEGYRVALVSRTSARHPGYLDDLAARGITATAYAADVTDTDRLTTVLDTIYAEHDVEFVYYGPGPTQQPVPITEVDTETARSAFDSVWPAVRTVGVFLPRMLDRGRGGLLFAGGLSSVRPMPMLGQLALAAGALRNYVRTLHAAVAGHGVYVGTLTIGGLVERGDIHRMVAADPANYPAAEGHTLDPDVLADAAWSMYRTRERAEEVFDVLDG